MTPPTLFSASAIDALGARAETMVNSLGTVSAEPDRLVRLFLTPEHRRAADRVAAWMRDAGLAVSEDALGTVRGRLGGTSPQRLLIGSHIDTVINAGMYDGPFGVIAGIMAAEHFARTRRTLRYGIDVLAFGDEEGSRFPATLASSSACAGIFRPENLALADRNGVTLADAIKAYGKSPDDIAAAAYSPDEAAAYVEVHIEQGPVLEARNQPLGVVTAIIGQTYLNIEFLGEAGHAGTVPMPMRRDALAGAAEAMLLGESLARDTKGEVVATVGRIAVSPGATNVIPANVVVIFDIRSGSETARAQLCDRLRGRGPGDCRQAPPRTDDHDDPRGRDHAVPPGRAGRLRRRRPRARRRAAAARLRRRPRRSGNGKALSDRHAVRALPRRYQSQSDGIRRPARPRHGGRGVDRLHRTV